MLKRIFTFSARLRVIHDRPADRKKTTCDCNCKKNSSGYSVPQNRGCEGFILRRSGRQGKTGKRKREPIVESEELSVGRGNSISKGPEAAIA